jgi:hypothetical protein
MLMEGDCAYSGSKFLKGSSVLSVDRYKGDLEKRRQLEWWTQRLYLTYDE